jgi:hypothetical protein
MPVLQWAALVLFLQSSTPESGQTVVTDAPCAVKEDRWEDAPTGFYPLWEETGTVIGARRGYLGIFQARYGIADRFSIGVRPLEFVFRTPNIQGKALLYRSEGLSVAAHAEFLSLMPGASAAFTTSNFVSRIENLNWSVYSIPVGASGTFRLAPWVNLHTTAVAMTTFGRELETHTSLGVTSVVELKLHARHAFFLHGGEVGFWNHDFALVGASYRYHRGWFELRVGHFYRLTPDGRQGAPLLNLGFFL